MGCCGWGADQVDGGHEAEDDHGQSIFVAGGHQATAVHDGHTGQDSRDPQAEIRHREEHGEHAGSLVGVGQRGDQANTALEARAEGDSRYRRPGKEQRGGTNPQGQQDHTDARDQRAGADQHHSRCRHRSERVRSHGGDEGQDAESESTFDDRGGADQVIDQARSQ
jgi:hypothetical protein